MSLWLEIWLCGEVFTRGAVKYSYNAGKCSCRGKTCGEVACGELPSHQIIHGFCNLLNFKLAGKCQKSSSDGVSPRATSPRVFPLHEHFPTLYEYLTVPHVNTSPHSHISSHCDTSRVDINRCFFPTFYYETRQVMSQLSSTMWRNVILYRY